VSEVFVVDDNPNNLNLLSGILRGQGYRVRMLDHGVRALKAMRSSPPDLVLLDITMPDMDGFEVCRQLKAFPDTASIPVLFISALDDSTDKVEAFRAGGVDYVTKPFQAEEVLARVACHLKIARLQRETEAKNAELREAYEEVRRGREELQVAQHTIARLSDPAGRVEDTSAWAKARAKEIAGALGLREIGVWRLRDGRLHDLVADGTGIVVAGDAMSGQLLAEGMTPAGVSVHPVPGADGRAVGALTIDTMGVALGDVERQVVTSFAHHLGTAIELAEMRGKLAAAETRRAATRRELRRQGITTAGLCQRCGRCFPEALDSEALCPDDGSPLDCSRLLPFRIQGRHRLEGLLGEGGMGAVFRAHDESLKRDVALKIIRAENLRDPSFSTRLLREAEVLARVRHPGVIALHDAGELPDGSAYLVMELLEGLELRTVLEQHGPGTPRQVARLVRQVGSALAAVHRVGVIHRDIKPANIFLVADEEGFAVKVMDFGVALPLTAEGRLTASGLIVGTPSYMAPEQATGPDVDERADLYALAAVAYEALLGRKTVQAAVLVDILVELLYEVPPAPSSLRAGLPPEVDEAFERALTKRPEERPRDVLQWANDLASILESARENADRSGWPPIGQPSR